MKSKWTGYYAVQVQIDVNEWALDGQITRGENNKPRLFTSKEEAQEQGTACFNCGEQPNMYCP